MMATRSITPPRRGRWTWLAAVALVGVLSGVPQTHAQSSKPTEYQVKGVYLLNFGRFVARPGHTAAGGNPVNVCVLGQDPFGPSLDEIVAGEAINGVRVGVRRILRPQEA